MVVLLKNNIQSKNNFIVLLIMLFSASLSWAQEDLRFCREAEIFLTKNKLDEAV